MGNSPQGEGWWQASDGKWYPPQVQQPPSPADHCLVLVGSSRSRSPGSVGQVHLSATGAGIRHARAVAIRSRRGDHHAHLDKYHRGGEHNEQAVLHRRNDLVSHLHHSSNHLHDRCVEEHIGSVQPRVSTRRLRNTDQRQRSRTWPRCHQLGSGPVAAVRRALIGSVRAYRSTLSPDHGLVARLRRAPFCPQRPTCSTYALEQLRLGDPLATTVVRIVRRVARCR